MLGRKISKKISGLIAVMITTGMLTGCVGGVGSSGQDEPVNSIPEQKGRYVEAEMDLPEGIGAEDIADIYTEEGKLRLLIKKNDNGITLLEEWELADGNFHNVTEDFLKEISISYTEYGAVKLLRDKAGVRYLYAVIREEEEIYKGHLWISQDGSEATEITPKSWAELDEELNYYQYPEDLVVLDNGTLAGIFYWKMAFYGEDDGTLIKEVVFQGNYMQTLAAVGENYYLLKSEDGLKVSQIDIFHASGTTLEDSLEKSIVINQSSSSSYSYIDITKEGGMVLCNGDGFYRCGADEENFELFINGIDTSLGRLDIWCVDMAAPGDGSYFTLFRGENDNGALMKYEYDPDAVIEVTETVTLFTVQESFLLQQAAVMFHKENPEVVIKIDTAVSYNDLYGGTIDYQQIYQDLNTKLTAGKGADILVMDELDIDSFTDKGLLADINDVVAGLEESGELLTNITGSYLKEDGRRYVVPLQFGLVLTVGRDADMDKVRDIPALAEALSKENESFMGPLTPAELVSRYLPYFLSDIIDGKTLDKEALATNLEYLKAIGENSQIVSAYSETERAWNIWDMASKARLSYYQVDGFNQAMLPISMANLIKGAYTAFENAYYPKLQMGINAQSEHVDTAKEFLAYVLSSEIQNEDYYEGFPVNAASLEYQAGLDRQLAEAYTTIEVAEGIMEEFHIKSYDNEDAIKLVEACKAADKQAWNDVKIREEIILAIPRYLNGEISAKETADQVEAALRMYLAE